MTNTNNDFLNNLKKLTMTDGKIDLEKIKKTLNEFLVVKSPLTIPENIKEFLVKFFPYLSIISIIATIPMILSIIGVNIFIVPFLATSQYSFNIILSNIYAVISIIFQIIIIPGLFKRSKKTWDLMFYFLLIGFVYNILRLDIGGVVIGSTLSAFILFQLRSKYTN